MLPPRYGWFTVRTECSHCGQPLPLNGPAQQLSCAHCLQDVHIPDELWRQVFDAYEEHYARLPVGERRAETFAIEGLRVRFEYAHGGLTCEKCGTQFGSDSLAVGNDRDFSCHHCGDPASAYRPAGWLAGLVPTVVQLYSIDPGGGESDADSARFEPPNKAVRPVVLACPQCGGSLSATVENSRILPCQYCHSDIYLPDEVWRRLHPVKIVTPFFVRFEGKTRFELAQEREAQADHEERVYYQRLKEENRRHRQAEQQADQRELDTAVASLKGRAWIAALVSTILMTAFAAWVWTSRAIFGVEPTSDLGFGLTRFLGGVAILVLLAAMHFASRPIQRRANNPFEWLLFVTWFWVPFALLMPVVGQGMALYRVFALLRGRFGATTISSGQHSSAHYEQVTLPDGEGHPAALLFFCLAVLWPVALLGLAPWHRLFG